MKNGAIVKIGERKWKVLDQTEKGVVCIYENWLEKRNGR